MCGRIPLLLVASWCVGNAAEEATAQPVADSFCYPVTPVDLDLTLPPDGEPPVVCAYPPPEVPNPNPMSSFYHRAFNPYDPTFHLGEDWNGDKGDNTDRHDPVYAIADGVVVFNTDVEANDAQFPDNDGANCGVSNPEDCDWHGWGKVVMIQHHLPDATVYYSLYGHLETVLVPEICHKQQFSRVSGGSWTTDRDYR